MRVHFDFSVFYSTPDAGSYGYVSGETEVENLPNAGTSFDLMARHPEIASALHNLKVDSVLPSTGLASQAILRFEDVVVPTDMAARDLFAFLAREYGYDAWPYGEDAPCPQPEKNSR